jgi:PTH1 family peptidyl-tRNA hydrolase
VPFWKRHDENAAESDLWLIVGLGNPGAKYAKTRHNIGFDVVNRFAQRLGLRFHSSKHRADTARGMVGSVPVLLALPQTFMNESGQAVTRLQSYFRVPLARTLIVCDDFELPFGTIRLRPKGTSGGQKGLRSIIDALGSEEFPRLRLGVGRPQGSAIGHVLGEFPPEQLAAVPALADIACDAIYALIERGIEPAMNDFNRSWTDELAAQRV